MRDSTARLAGDLKGGIASAVLSIPIAIGFGLFAFDPLGSRYEGYGVLAGLYSAVFVPIVVVALRARTGNIFAPRSMVAFLISSVLIHLVNSNFSAYLDRSGDTLALVFMVLALAGIFQVLFGALRLGDLVKYIPYPVTAGFQNGAALLLLLSQLDVSLGFRRHVPFDRIWSHAEAIQPLTVSVVAITCMTAILAPRFAKRIPGIIVGMVFGIVAYYALFLAGFDRSLGVLIGDIAFIMPDLRYIAAAPALLADPALAGLLPLVFAWAASLALIASLDTLLCAKVLEGITGAKFDNNLNLVRLGVANAVASAFGAIPSAINLAASQANYYSGGRTRLSLIVSALVILGGTYYLAGLIGLIPRSVIAGLLIVTALRLFDRWTLQLLRRALTGELLRLRGSLLDLGIIVLVTAVAVTGNLIAAVLLGILVSVVSFLFRISRSVIHRRYGGEVVQSRKTRDSRQAALLAERGREILVLELQGPIFFGTAEKLAGTVERSASDGARYIILDLRRVTDLDSTGARILLQLNDRLVRDGRALALSSLDFSSRLRGYLDEMGVLAALGRKCVFASADAAIEWAEDRIVLEHAGDIEPGEEFPFSRLDVLLGMAEGEIAVLRPLLERRAFAKGESVFSEGDRGTEMFIIASGSASVTMRLPGTDRETRLVTFAPGTVFGELALLDTEARSATVEADEDLVCYVLPEKTFRELVLSHPAIAIKLLSNLGRELSARLRRANRIIYQLDS